MNAHFTPQAPLEPRAYDDPSAEERETEAWQRHCGELTDALDRYQDALRRADAEAERLRAALAECTQAYRADEPNRRLERAIEAGEAVLAVRVPALVVNGPCDAAQMDIEWAKEERG